MECFEKNYEVFAEKKDLSPMMEAYNDALVNKDRQVRVLDPKGEYTGMAMGINEKGELLVQKKMEKSKRFMRARFLSGDYIVMYDLKK